MAQNDSFTGFLLHYRTPPAEKWAPYDRGGLNGENLVRVFTGMEQTDICVTNYLDLCCRSSTADGQNVYAVNATPPQTQRA